MKLFVDDERLPPTTDRDWVLVRDPNIAIRLLEIYPDDIEVLSLDHDLGNDSLSGYDIAAWLEKEVWTYATTPPKVLKVHSANPVGRKHILQAFESIVRFCVENGMPIPRIEL